MPTLAHADVAESFARHEAHTSVYDASRAFTYRAADADVDTSAAVSGGERDLDPDALMTRRPAPDRRYRDTEPRHVGTLGALASAICDAMVATPSGGHRVEDRGYALAAAIRGEIVAAVRSIFHAWLRQHGADVALDVATDSDRARASVGAASRCCERGVSAAHGGGDA